MTIEETTNAEKVEPAGTNMPRRIRLTAFFLPWIGFLLIVPPFVNIVGDRQIFGIPAIGLFLFAIWIALIAVAYLVQKFSHSTTQVAPEQFPKTETDAQSEPLNTDITRTTK